MAHQIDCIEKADPYEPTEAIHSIGGRNPSVQDGGSAKKRLFAG
jgi:hypothetical protein